MNNLLLDAMNDIDNAYILSAGRRLGYCGQLQGAKAARIHSTVRKTLALIAAIAAFVAICFTTAMAMSPEFRSMVFRIFRAKQQVTISGSPDHTEVTPDNMFVEPVIRIGEVIEGKYVHTPIASRATDGVLLVCTDEVESKQGSHYDAYCEKGGELVRLEKHLFRQHYTLRGTEFDVEFEWTEHNGKVVLTWIAESQSCFVPRNAGAADSMLLKLRFTGMNAGGEEMETWYPVLVDLHTGELRDVLFGTGAEQLAGLYNAAISEDAAVMLLQQNCANGDKLYCADLAAKRLHSLDDLSGEHAAACSLVEGKLVCWNMSDDRCKAWSIDLVTLARTELFDLPVNITASEGDAGIVFLMGFDSWVHEGNMYAGSRFALEVEESRSVNVIDLATGARVPLEGYKWQQETQLIPSPDGKKLLITGGYFRENKYEYIGVLDTESMIFAEFSRSNTDDSRELLISWFDENTVCIASDAEGDMCRNHYLYSLAEGAA